MYATIDFTKNQSFRIHEKGLELALNEEVLGLIEGADFAKAYFSIWLGQYPLNSKFKEQLLSD